LVHPAHRDLATTQRWLAVHVARDPAVVVEFAVEYRGSMIGKVGGDEMLQIDPRNDASRRLLQKLGFHCTRHARNTICSDGVWADSDYYALPRPGPKKESI